MAASLFLGGLSFLLAVVWGRPLIRLLRAKRIGKQIRIEGPQTHLVKAGTPTMGGLMIIVPVAIISGLLTLVNIIVETNQGHPIANIGEQILVPTVTMLIFGLLGAYDDWQNVRGKRVTGEGMAGRYKFAMQIGFATLIALVLHFGPSQLTSIALPGIAQKIDMGLLWIPFAVFWIVGFSNAVNLTDGLDGLAIGSVLIAAAAYTVLTYVTGHVQFSAYLDLIHIPRIWELTIFGGAMVGASLGFLWFNCYPAQVFMGDVGSLALGGAIGTVALLIKQELLLMLVGGLFVVEALSVIIQVGSFKLTGKRVFRMAPLHHHFELMGWKEPKIIIRFWIVAIIFALASLTTLKLR